MAIVYTEHIAIMISKVFPRGGAVYANWGSAETTNKVTENSVEQVESLKYNQAKVDSRILYCICAARKGATKIIV